MAWYRDDGGRCDFRAGNRGDAIVKINNPPQTNVIATSDPLTIQAAEAAVAGVLGQVSDSGHLHPVDLSDFLVLLGAQQTEGSSTSTSPVDLISITGLTIPVETPLLIIGSVRKTAGASASVSFGLKINATVVSEASANTDRIWLSSGADAAESGAFVLFIAPRLADYERAAARFGGGESATGPDSAWALFTADIPTVEITDIVIRGDGANALVTFACDDLRVYALPTT